MSGKMQRTVVCMYDGFGYDYYEMSPLPTMKRMASEGFSKKGSAVFPTLTNANNLSIICASWPEKHGVTTNCYFDENTNTAKYLEDSDFICSPTIFQFFREKRKKSALLTCKEKTLKIVGKYADLAIAAESPTEELTAKYGVPPSMYSCDVNYWLWSITLDILKTHTDIELLYVHTTDYPMHKWAPHEEQSLQHMARLDEMLAEATHIAPDAIFLITADHGMNPKKRCIDLGKTCRANGINLRFAVSPVADRLLEHHRGFGGVSYVYVHSQKEIHVVAEFLKQIKGVDDVLSRSEASAKYHLMPERIGDLVVLADIETVFGDLETPDELLAPMYRNHGSLYEKDIPLIAYGYEGASPRSEEILMNFDLTRWLCETRL